MNRNLKSFLTIFLLLISYAGFTQNKSFKISGKISSGKGTSLTHISIYISSLQKGVITNDNGEFTLTVPNAGNFILQLSGIGYARKTIAVEVPAKPLVIILDEENHSLDQVNVSGKSRGREIKQSGYNVNVIETKEAKLRSSDLGEIMARTSGVSVLRSAGLGSDVKFSINGLSGDQIRFFLDGIPLEYTPYSFGVANVPVNLVERIDVYKGVMPIQFGSDALGGGVNLNKAPVRGGFHGSVSYQPGSFNTHRTAVNLNYANDSTGLYTDVSAFYDFSKNNYKVNVEVPDEQGKLYEVSVPRFHDKYKAKGVNFEVGLRNRKFADKISLEGYLSDYAKDIQHNNTMSGNPFGEAAAFQKTSGINFHYDNSFTDKFNVKFTAGYNYNEREFLDTTKNRYNWFGEAFFRSPVAGETGASNNGPSHQYLWTHNSFIRWINTYKIADNQEIALSIAPTYTTRSGKQELTLGYYPFSIKSNLQTAVTGIHYKFTTEKAENVLFAKNYYLKYEGTDPPSGQELPVMTLKKAVNWGVGDAFTYRLSSRVMAKLSYEWAVRLPNTDEIFGDGIFILDNLNLVPERSHNVNFEVNLSNKPGAVSKWNIQAIFFYRKIKDLILLLQSPGITSVNANVYNATSYGGELNLYYSAFKDHLKLTGNTTIQSFRNVSDSGLFQDFNGDRIPNTPYYFANASAEFIVPKISNDTKKLSVFYNGRYVHSFYLSWESLGLKETKLYTPAQFSHNAGVTYQFNINHIKTSLTGDIQNLTNQRLYDYYGVQRPGRAFYLKLTAQF